MMKKGPYGVSLILAGIVVAVIASCDSTDTTGDPPGKEFQRSEMLAHLANAVILPSYDALQESVGALHTATGAFAGDPTPANLTTLRTSLKAARMAWQDANLFQFGPAESLTLRAALNTYPADEAQIEENVESGDYVLGTIENRAAVGFPAVAYLLYGVGDSDDEVISAYTDAPDASGRMSYLVDNVDFIRSSTDAVVDDWSASGGDYVGTFLSAENAGTDVGSSLGMLINAFVLHYERFLRDGKIAIPAGVRSMGVPRPTATEAYYGGYSVELAVTNLQALRRLFLGNGPDGTEGLGLDDNLIALEAPALASEIETALDEAVAAVQTLNDPLAEQIESDNEAVLEAFTELQDPVVLLKADMTSVLGITITFQDNDGD